MASFEDMIEINSGSNCHKNRKVIRDEGASSDDEMDDNEDDDGDKDKLLSLPFDFLFKNKLLRLLTPTSYW